MRRRPWSVEISLGGTGLADYGILTSFAGDYRIAAGTRWASTAKLQMVSLAKEGSKLVANTDTGISADVSFGSGGQVRAEPDRLIFGKQDLPLQLGPDLDFPGYQTALAAAGGSRPGSRPERRGYRLRPAGLRRLLRPDEDHPPAGSDMYSIAPTPASK